MNFTRGTIKSSPYVGVFCTVTEEIALAPHSALPKEVQTLEQQLGVSVIRANIGNSSLLGVLSRGLGRKIAASSIIEDIEVSGLESQGIEVLKLGGFTSTGNLIALNRNGGIASPLIDDEGLDELKGFFGIKFERMKVADNDLAGASLTVTNKGLIAHPNIREKEFERVQKILKVGGRTTTANYGDLFVGNSVIANTKGAIAGQNTSGIELSKIDEGLSGE
ncbi:MAG TPA: translation initiation factor IF-6 [Candidatus Diapherotrites archaeon]|uniref:Translation initiation factor IF-6 n=1 Tax=Candidatus Iainarchaeum sp. TaxID=3101447 RepID=A0A7J4IW35_9ARCH|nr:translation initiation factor IF-6 [Candidatus Diapherotrites archaeon]